MLKRLSLLALAAAAFLSIGYADQSQRKIVIPVDKTNPTDGKEMYNNYCAPCHGIDARGHGPAAVAMRTQPTDLTMLTRLNHGKYPNSHVTAVLMFGSELPAHGSAGMPVWGPILGRMKVASLQEEHLRISNLNRYLEHLQVK